MDDGSPVTSVASLIHAGKVVEDPLCAPVVEGAAAGVLQQHASLRGRQVEHVLPDFTHEQFLQRPLLLHEQHMDILRSREVRNPRNKFVRQQLVVLARPPFCDLWRYEIQETSSLDNNLWYSRVCHFTPSLTGTYNYLLVRKNSTYS